MKHAVLFLALALGASAQTLSLTGPASARPGQSITVTVATSGVTTAAGLQWTMTPFPADATVQAGSAAIAAGKNVAFDAASGITLISGINANVMAAGTVALYTFAMPATALTLTISEPLGATLSAAAITITPSATPFAVSLLAIEDLNGDGKVDAADYDEARMQVKRGKAWCTTADVNKDGKCNVLDLQQIIKAIQ